MKYKRWFAFVSLALVAVVALTACGAQTSEPPAAPDATATPVPPTATPVPPTPTPMPGADMQGGTVVMGFYQEPELLNPFIRTQTIAGVAGDFLERGLTIVLPSGERVPDLVTEVPSVDN
jgi:hypothetical protein